MSMILFQLGQLGRAIKRVAAAIWSSFASWTPASNSSGWAGYTMRLVVDASLTPNASQLRFTLSTFTGFDGFTVRNAYVGIKAASGDAYDFSATPTQITFNGGSAGCTVGTSGAIVSDPASLSLSSADSLVIAVSLVDAGVALSSMAARPSQTGWLGYYKNANDAATVNATGYTSGQIYLVTNVEYLP